MIAAAGTGSTLFFNYSTKFNEPWDDGVLENQNGYDAVFPPAGSVGLAVSIGED